MHALSAGISRDGEGGRTAGPSAPAEGVRPDVLAQDLRRRHEEEVDLDGRSAAKSASDEYRGIHLIQVGGVDRDRGNGRAEKGLLGWDEHYTGLKVTTGERSVDCDLRNAAVGILEKETGVPQVSLNSGNISDGGDRDGLWRCGALLGQRVCSLCETGGYA
jgi:hypothetical protein